MKWLFDYFYNELSAGAGFRIFGPGHLAFLFAIALAVSAACAAYRRARPKTQLSILRCAVYVCLALELSKQIVIFMAWPSYPIDQLPLHLCTLGIFVQAADAFMPRLRKTAREILYSLSLPGAAAALLFPGWAAFPILNIFSLHSFLMHGILLCYPLLLLTSRQLRPNWRNLWRSALFVLVTAIPLYFFNKRFATNFYFVNGSAPGSPLEALENLMGNPGYLLGYAALVLVIWLAMYAPFIIWQKNSGKRE
jgi:hypothetical integral membrane protein (TIGR02206 family)